MQKRQGMFGSIKVAFDHPQKVLSPNKVSSWSLPTIPLTDCTNLCTGSQMYVYS